MTAAKVRVAAHAMLFLLAVVVFYLGLGLGLQFNPPFGGFGLNRRDRVFNVFNRVRGEPPEHRSINRDV